MNIFVAAFFSLLFFLFENEIKILSIFASAKFVDGSVHFRAIFRFDIASPVHSTYGCKDECEAIIMCALWMVFDCSHHESTRQVRGRKKERRKKEQCIGNRLVRGMMHSGSKDQSIKIRRKTYIDIYTFSKVLNEFQKKEKKNIRKMLLI